MANNISLLELFDFTLDDTENKDEAPVCDIGECWDCGWKGKVSACSTEQESEGWEYESYTVHICPECGGVIGDYDYSEDMIDEANKYYGVNDD